MRKNVKESRNTLKKSRLEVISSRKSCSASGVGLSHYILVDRKAK